MNEAHIKLEIKEDFGWVDGLDIREIDGRYMLANAESELPFNVSHVMEEQEFVQKYLLGFALGNSIGINYFPSAQWYSFTYNGTRAVLVVKRDPDTRKVEPVLLIPPLTNTQLTDEDRQLLRRASDVIHSNAHDNLKMDNMSANLEVSDILRDEEIGLKAKRMTYRDLINPEYFAKFNIIPQQEEKIYYIRDILRKGRETKAEDLNRAREIFYREANNETVTREEYQFISDLTLGEYEVEDKVNTAPTTASAAKDGKSGIAGGISPTADPENPFEC